MWTLRFGEYYTTTVDTLERADYLMDIAHRHQVDMLLSKFEHRFILWLQAYYVPENERLVSIPDGQMMDFVRAYKI